MLTPVEVAGKFDLRISGGLAMLTLSKRIIVAIDGSPQSDKAAEEAARLASISGTKFKSQLYAVLVLPSMKTPSFTDFFPE